MSRLYCLPFFFLQTLLCAGNPPTGSFFFELACFFNDSKGRSYWFFRLQRGSRLVRYDNHMLRFISALRCSTAASPPRPGSLGSFVYKPRIRYSPIFSSRCLEDFLLAKDETIVVLAHTYRHEATDVTVTVIPISHYAHPSFYQQVDMLCQQHHSVLMEGRTPIGGAMHSTMVPPRSMVKNIRPLDCEENEGWEPNEDQAFWQPFSWGVKDSPNMTVIHAADRYDYECLPWWAGLRFNMPFLGSYAREKHCLDMIPELVKNGYKSFAIPWGAGHSRIFHDMLVDNGFENVASCSLLMWSRVDGDRSAAECCRLERLAKRRDRRIFWAQVSIVMVFCYYFLRGSVTFTTHRPDDDEK